MTLYHIVISLDVAAQIREQVLFIAQHSIDNALAWEDWLSREIQAIRQMPAGHPVDEAATHRLGATVRKVVFERTFLIFYTIDEVNRRIEIVHLRHGARLPQPGKM